MFQKKRNIEEKDENGSRELPYMLIHILFLILMVILGVIMLACASICHFYLSQQATPAKEIIEMLIGIVLLLGFIGIVLAIRFSITSFRTEKQITNSAQRHDDDASYGRDEEVRESDGIESESVFADKTLPTFTTGFSTDIEDQ